MEEGNLLVEAEGHCFFCLDKIPSLPPFKLKPQRGGLTNDKMELSNPPIYSLQYFSRYLKMDMTRVFSTNEPISPELWDKVERAKLKVELCEECASQNERLHKLFTHLEKIEMEIRFYVNLIHGKLVAAETEQLSRSAGPNLSRNFLGKLEIVNALRDEANNKCAAKLPDTIAPRVNIQNKTKRQLNLEKLKIKVRTRRNSFNNARKYFVPSDHLDLPVANFEPSHPTSDSLTNDDGDNESYPCEASDPGDLYFDNSTVPSPTPTLAVEQKPTNISNISLSKTINEVRVGDTRSRLNHKTGKYKCEVCSKEFFNSWNFSKHYKAVHLKVRYKCRFCSKEFTQQDNHRRHLKKEHLGI